MDLIYLQMKQEKESFCQLSISDQLVSSRHVSVCTRVHPLVLWIPSRKKEETVIVIVSPGCESQALVGIGIASHSSSSTTLSEVSALLANDASLIDVLL